MKAEIDLRDILKKGQLADELDLERAFILDRKLRLLVKDHPELAEERKQLRLMIKSYEKIHWSSSSTITDKQIKESDDAEYIAEQERKFIENRKEHINKRIKSFNMTQQQLGILLGHNKSYMSELMNGINPFSHRDLIIIHRLFNIDLKYLIPTIISETDKGKLKITLTKLKNPNLKLVKANLVYA
jgi:predicted XRE-type DNA-binding protein